MTNNLDCRFKLMKLNRCADPRDIRHERESGIPEDGTLTVQQYLGKNSFTTIGCGTPEFPRDGFDLHVPSLFTPTILL